jgi:hypothetical protein
MGTIETTSPAGGRPPWSPAGRVPTESCVRGGGNIPWVIGNFVGKHNFLGRVQIGARTVELITDKNARDTVLSQTELGLFTGSPGLKFDTTRSVCVIPPH